MTKMPISVVEPMGPEKQRSWWHHCVSAAFVSLGFFLLFSSAGVSISLVALAALAALRARMLWRTAPWKEPIMAVGLLLVAYIAVHTIWTTGWNADSARAVNQYHELLLAPLLLALLHDARHRRMFGRGLMAGAMVLALLYWLGLVLPSLMPFLHTRRISSGFGLAVCAFLVLMHARTRPKPWPARALAALLAVTVLFAVDSRTGHLVVLVLVACAAWLHSPARWRWPAALTGLALVVALGMNSGAVNTRIQETLAGTQPAPGPEGLTSTGIRIELMRLSAELSLKYALTGAGFANYSEAHEEAARARYGGNPATAPYLRSEWIHAANPHNEFAMQLIGGGIGSLALFLVWLGMTMIRAQRAAPPLAGMLGGTCLAFAVGCLFNSMLMNFVEGHVYMGLLTLLLARVRHAQEDAQSVRGILLVATRQIGDVLLTTPLIRAARQRWPQARIDVLGFEGTLGMLRGNPDVDELMATPARLGWNGFWQLGRRLWRKYDLALITDVGDRAHLMGWLAAPLRCGIIPASNASNWWKEPLLRHAVVAAGDLGKVHVTAEKLSLLSPWLDELGPGASKVVAPPRTGLPAHVESQLERGAVLLHAPSMWPYKQWPIAHFETLVKALLAQGRQVVLTGSGGTRDQACIAPLRDLGSAPRLLDLSGQLDFNQLVTLFEKAALYIGPDTSVSHLAAAAGVPVIAILGPTNPARWAPAPATPAQPFVLYALEQQAGNVTVMQSGMSCVPCGRAGCEDHRQSRSDCLGDITPERVLAQAMKVLAGARQERH